MFKSGWPHAVTAQASQQFWFDSPSIYNCDPSTDVFLAPTWTRLACHRWRQYCICGTFECWHCTHDIQPESPLLNYKSKQACICITWHSTTVASETTEARRRFTFPSSLRRSLVLDPSYLHDMQVYAQVWWTERRRCMLNALSEWQVSTASSRLHLNSGWWLHNNSTLLPTSAKRLHYICGKTDYQFLTSYNPSITGYGKN